MEKAKMIVVDLTREKIDVMPMRDDLARDYIGGEGTGTRLLWEMVKPHTDALAPGNTIVFATGPLNGTIFPAGPRGTVVFKSPETGTVSMSNIGGHWTARLKFAGYDLVAVTGKAKRPVYLFIDDETVELRDAEHIWGTTIPEMEEGLKKEIGGSTFDVLGIGPAGERMVRLASVANNIRFAGKGGSGAVMGSKNFKAITIRGSGMVPIKDIWRLRDISHNIMEAMKTSEPIQALQQGSSAAFNQTVAELQDFGYKHFQEGGWKDGHKLYIENIVQALEQEHRACYACPIACGVISKVKKGDYKGTKTGGPMAEAYWNWGWKCGITDIDAICKITELCNNNGLCVNSTSELAAWMMECQERGLLSTEETGGLKLSWGDGKGSVKMTEMLIERNGFGNILAEGVKRAAEKVGHGTEEYAMHVKGMELDGDEWRQNKSSALTAAVAERGASVVRPWGFPIDMGVVFHEITGLKEKPDPSEEKGIAKWYKPYKEFTIASNCVGVCLYPALFNIPSVKQTLDAYTAIAGREIDLKEYLKVGERTVCVQRAFNAREGFDRKDDTLPKRILKEPIKGGKYDGQRIENLDAMLDEYYQESGFDKKTGWPTRGKLEELGLNDVADELYKK
ncbi:MAG: aldehyde ferredoxin oxidoreductase family protein [Deltaproteobacteria bacterium]|nr:aldehyde ferredoxin oxidoreductase family protein [Deltaproteobacteria bacterium]